MKIEKVVRDPPLLEKEDSKKQTERNLQKGFDGADSLVRAQSRMTKAGVAAVRRHIEKESVRNPDRKVRGEWKPLSGMRNRSRAIQRAVRRMSVETGKTVKRTAVSAVVPSMMAVQAVEKSMDTVKEAGKTTAKMMKNAVENTIVRADANQQVRNRQKKKSVVDRLIRVLTDSQKRTAAAVMEDPMDDVRKASMIMASSSLWGIGLAAFLVIMLLCFAWISLTGVVVSAVGYVILNSPLGLFFGEELYDNEMLSVAVVQEYHEDFSDRLTVLLDGYEVSEDYNGVHVEYHYPAGEEDYALEAQIMGTYLAEHTNVPYTDGMYGFTEPGFGESNYIAVMEASQKNEQNLKEVFHRMVYYTEEVRYFDQEGNLMDPFEPEEDSIPETESETVSDPVYITKMFIEVYYLSASDYMTLYHPGDQEMLVSAQNAAKAFLQNVP